MNKSELISLVADNSGLTRKDTERAINAALDQLEPAEQKLTQARVAEALYVWPLSAALLISLLLVLARLWPSPLQSAWNRERQS